MTKGKKGVVATIKSQRAKQAASPVGQLADTVLGFALPAGKVKAAAMGLRAAGQAGNRLKFLAAEALEGRLAAKALVGSRKAKSLYPVKDFAKYKSPNSYNSTTSTNYSLPLGLGIIGGAAVVGANAAKDNARKAAIKKASTKTRKGQTRGR